MKIFYINENYNFKENNSQFIKKRDINKYNNLYYIYIWQIKTRTIDDNRSFKKEYNFKLNISCGEEIFYGLTFFGRLIMTIFSINGVFFIYNLIIQFILLIPGLLSENDHILVQLTIAALYIIFSILITNVLIIPAYEFFLFSF